LSDGAPLYILPSLENGRYPLQLVTTRVT